MERADPHSKPRTTRRRGARAARVLLALVLVAAVGGAAFVLILETRPGGRGAVDWAARRVVSIVERSIVPEVGFERFEYESPRTLRFLDLTLTAPDGTRVASAEVASVTLTEIPRVGRPVLIERVRLRGGLVELIEEEGADGRMGFRGLVPFVEGAPASASDEASAPRQGFEPEPRLSDALRIRRVELENCGVRYTPAGGGAPMRLEGITSALDVEPVDEAGRLWHAFALESSRGGVFSAALNGRVDLDRLVVELWPSTVRFDMREGPAEELPPGIQALLRDREARGVMRVDVSGSAPLREFEKADLRASVELTGFNLALSETYRLPVSSAMLEGRLTNGVATLTTGDLALLGGDALVGGELDLREASMPASARWSLEGVELKEALRGAPAEGEASGGGALAGKVRASGRATLSASAGLESLRGEGTFEITEGRFAGVSLFERLVRAIDVGKMTAASRNTSAARGTFTLRGGAADFSSVELVTPVLSARGQGVLHFDGRLDFLLNAGPLERVQDALGEVGRVFGIVSDQLVKYRVRGTAGSPTVDVVPFGIGAAVEREALP